MNISLNKIKNELLNNKIYHNLRIRKAGDGDYIRLYDKNAYEQIKKIKKDNNKFTYLPLLQVRDIKKERIVTNELLLDEKAFGKKSPFRQRFLKILRTNILPENKFYLFYGRKDDRKHYYENKYNSNNLRKLINEVNNNEILWVGIRYKIDYAKVNKNFGFCIEYLEVLKKIHDKLDPIRLLNSKKEKTGQKTVNQEQRAALAWNILAREAKSKNKITYGELSKGIGIHHRPLRYVLGLIQDYCLDNKLPPLTILVVNQSGKPGTGFIAWDVDYLKEGYSKVFKYNWSNLDNPFGYAEDGTTENEIIKKLIKSPSSSKNVYARIKVRGIMQQIFRKALLRVYSNRCAFCGISFVELLEACHIIPWSKSNDSQKMDIRNGILLCSNHHKLFDNGYIIIDPNKFTISYTAKVSNTVKKLLNPINNKLFLPINKNLYPKLVKDKI